MPGSMGESTGDSRYKSMKRIRTINVKIGCASGYSECLFRTKIRRIVAENRRK